MIVSTTNDVAGYKIIRHLGVVRGITVRSRSVIGMRYDANDIMDGITEVLAYGTAVWVEPV